MQTCSSHAAALGAYLLEGSQGMFRLTGFGLSGAGMLRSPLGQQRKSCSTYYCSGGKAAFSGSSSSILCRQSTSQIEPAKSAVKFEQPAGSTVEVTRLLLHSLFQALHSLVKKFKAKAMLLPKNHSGLLQVCAGSLTVYERGTYSYTVVHVLCMNV